jgi:hypothetical protein
MSNPKRVFLLLSVFCVTFVYSQNDQYTDWKNYRLKGKVIKFKEDNYYAKRKDGILKIDLDGHFGYSEHKFDKDGFETSSICDCNNIDDTKGAEYIFEVEEPSKKYLGYLKYNADKEEIEKEEVLFFSDQLIVTKTVDIKGNIRFDSLFLGIGFKDSINISYFQRKNGEQAKYIYKYVYNDKDLMIYESFIEYKIKSDDNLKFIRENKLKYSYTSFDEEVNWTGQEAINGYTGKTEQFAKRKYEYYK